MSLKKLLFTLLLLPSLSANATLISTLDDVRNNNRAFLSGLGHDGYVVNGPLDNAPGLHFRDAVETYGQTFTVGADSVLENFSFLLSNNQAGVAVDFAVYLMAWDGVKGEGPILFESSPLSTANVTGVRNFDLFSVMTDSLALETGREYVAFISTSAFYNPDILNPDFTEDNAPSLRSATFLGVTGNPYTEGSRFTINNGGDFDLLTSQNWTSGGSIDLAFSLEFSPTEVPEPSALALFGLALAGMAVRRRKANKAC